MEDILIHIYSFIEYAVDAYNMRLVNNEWANAGLQFIKHSDNDIYFRSTFVFCKCSVCNSSEYKYMRMPHDDHPPHCICFCDKWKCHADVLASLLQIFNNENIYLWVKWYPLTDTFPVLRSSGEYSIGKAVNNIFNIENSPVIALTFKKSCYINKEDIYKEDNSDYVLWKHCKPSTIDIKYIKGNPCFLSLFPKAQQLFTPYVSIILDINNNINVHFRIQNKVKINLSNI